MIEVQEIRKSFGDIQAVKGISFSVREGEIFGFLGPNGAGKTTTISIISGLMLADSGSVRIAGMDIHKGGAKVRSLLGVVPQEISLYEELSGRENLHFWGSLYGLSGARLRAAADRVLDLVGLTERSSDPVREYSGGMKRRLNLCAGLIHRPRILLLDEPTLGIDPQARLAILDVIRGEVSTGTTVIYTTHYLEEAENLCERVAIIDDGAVLAQGSLDELNRIAGEEDLVTVAGQFAAERIGPLLGDVKVEHIDSDVVRFIVRDRSEVGRTLERLFSEGVRIDEISIKEPSLESVFIKLTGRELRD